MKILKSIGKAFCEDCLALYPIIATPFGDSYDPRGVKSIFDPSIAGIWSHISKEDFMEIEKALTEEIIEEMIADILDVDNDTFKITSDIYKGCVRRVVIKDEDSRTTLNVNFHLAMARTESQFYLITDEVLTGRKFITDINKYYQDEE